MFNALAYHLRRTHAFSSDVDNATIRQTVRAFRFGWLAYLLAALVSFASPIASFALYLLIGLYFFIPRGIDSGFAAGRREYGGSTTRCTFRSAGEPASVCAPTPEEEALGLITEVSYHMPGMALR